MHGCNKTANEESYRGKKGDDTNYLDSSGAFLFNHPGALYSRWD